MTVCAQTCFLLRLKKKLNSTLNEENVLIQHTMKISNEWLKYNKKKTVHINGIYA